MANPDIKVSPFFSFSRSMDKVPESSDDRFFLRKVTFSEAERVDVKASAPTQQHIDNLVSQKGKEIKNIL